MPDYDMSPEELRGDRRPGATDAQGEAYRMVREIDSEGRGLSRWEIDFMKTANLVLRIESFYGPHPLKPGQSFSLTDNDYTDYFSALGKENPGLLGEQIGAMFLSVQGTLQMAKETYGPGVVAGFMKIIEKHGAGVEGKLQGRKL